MISILILIVTCILSYRAFSDERLMRWGVLHPQSVLQYGQYYRLLSSGFLHLDWAHLLFNMVTLFFFGPLVEQQYSFMFPGYLGHVLFLAMYLLSIVLGDIPTVRAERNNYHYTSLGASGGVAGVMLAAVLLDPFQTISLYFFIKMPAIVWALLFMGYSWYRTYYRAEDGINHSAHLWGGTVGVVVTLLIMPSSGAQFLDLLLNKFRF